MPRADSGYPHNFMVNSWVLKDVESESEIKTNSGPRVCPHLVEGPYFACVEHAQCLLLAHCVSTHTHTHTHTHKNKQTKVYAPTHPYTHSHTQVYASTHASIHIYTHKYKFLHTQVYTCIDIVPILFRIFYQKDKF